MADTVIAVQIVEDIAKRMWLTYSSRNPSWGGHDDWEDQPEYRRDDFRAMAYDVALELGLITIIEPA